MIGRAGVFARFRWPFAWRSDLDAMRLRLTASHAARVEAEEALGGCQVELRKARMLIAQQAEVLRQHDQLKTQVATR